MKSTGTCSLIRRIKRPVRIPGIVEDANRRFARDVPQVAPGSRPRGLCEPAVSPWFDRTA